MFTIWFRVSEEENQQLSLEALGRDTAQAVWDKLKAGGFYMASTRP